MSDPVRDEQRAREGVVAVARPEAATLEIAGADRLAFLDRMLTQRVDGLTPGTGARAEFLDVKGRVISDLRLYAREDRLLAHVESSYAESTCQKLGMYVLRDDVQITDASACWQLTTVIGPHVQRIAEALGVSDDTPVLQSRTIELQGLEALVVRAAWTVGMSLDVYTPVDGSEALNAWLDAREIPRADSAVLEVLRIEAGVVRQGLEITDDVLPVELDLFGEAIVDKGCYPGQEVVTRIVHRGTTHRTLVGLTLDAADPPASGTPLTVDGHEIGHVTSAVPSRTRGVVVALAVVRKEHADPGERLDADGAVAQVTALPMPPA